MVVPSLLGAADLVQPGRDAVNTRSMPNTGGGNIDNQSWLMIFGQIKLLSDTNYSTWVNVWPLAQIHSLYTNLLKTKIKWRGTDGSTGTVSWQYKQTTYTCTWPLLPLSLSLFPIMPSPSSLWPSEKIIFIKDVKDIIMYKHVYMFVHVDCAQCTQGEPTTNYSS